MNQRADQMTAHQDEQDRQHVEALHRCVLDHGRVLSTFVDLLHDENELLLQPFNHTELAALTARKTRFAQELAHFDRLRSQYLAPLGHTDDPAGIAAVCAAHPVLKPAFDALWTIAEQARAANERNGDTLRTLTAHHQKALDALGALTGRQLYDGRGRLARSSGRTADTAPVDTAP